MKTDKTIPACLVLFYSNPELFDKYLLELDLILTALENQSVDVISQRLIEWYTTGDRFEAIGEEIESIKSNSYKEILSIPRNVSLEDSTSKILNRYRELRANVKKRLENQQK